MTAAILLAVLIGLGCWMTFAHNLLTHAPYIGRPYILYRRRYSTAR